MRRFIWVLSVAAVVLGSATLVFWRMGWALEPQTSKWHWGDVPTWVVAVSTTLALFAAGAGAVGIYRQLSLQQAEIIRRAKRDEQLRTAELREQAQLINVLPKSRSLTSDPPGHGPLYSLEVTNNSRRPIRDVKCRLFLNGRSFSPRGVWRTPNAFIEQQTVSILRRSSRAEFVFPVKAQDTLPEAAAREFSLRFTDDALLHWELGEDMHLKPINDRNDW